MQESLNALTKRLRTEKALKEQAQARVHELSFSVAAGSSSGGGGAGGVGGVGGGGTLGRADEHMGARPPPAFFRAPPAGGALGVFASSAAAPRRKPTCAGPLRLATTAAPF